MKNNKFSIITVCFNSEKTIEQTIKSVISQTYDNYEYIIVDGASTDNTLDIIKKYKEEYPDKILFISEKDNGIYDAMNKGIKMASGDIIGIINSDDWYESNALEIINAEYNKINDYNSIMYGLLRQYKDNKFFQIKGNSHEFLKDNMIPHPTCFVPKQIYDKYGSFSLDYRIVADYELMLRFYNIPEVNFHRVEKVLANFRIGGASNGYKATKETIRLKKNYKILSRKKEFLLKLKVFYLRFFK